MPEQPSKIFNAHNIPTSYYKCYKCRVPLTEENVFWKRDGHSGYSCSKCGPLLHWGPAVNNHRQRCKKLGVQVNTLVVKEWVAYLENHDGRCYYCHKQLPILDLTIDHKIPLFRGGENSIENVVAACLDCNLRKKTKTVEEYLDYLAKHDQ